MRGRKGGGREGEEGRGVHICVHECVSLSESGGN